MDEDVKICPGCEAEYYAHISRCATCEVELVWPDEAEAARLEIARAEADDQLVCIDQGDLERVGALKRGLKEMGITGRVLRFEQGCSSSDGYGLFVAASLAERAAGELEEIWYRMHPELKEADERQQAGLCPACGADISHSRGLCPDCGLNIGGTGGGDCGRSDCGGGCGAGH